MRTTLIIGLAAGLSFLSMLALIPREAPAPTPGAAARPHRVAVDLDPNPHRVEVRLVAEEQQVEISPGHFVTAWTYDGGLPGPTIEARVGDEVVVHLENRLPEATTIHWHGLRIPAAMDGTPQVQAPVQPGQTATWRFVVPDEGTFWYHPHAHESLQMERGLVGALIVHGPPGAARFDADRVLVLDDLKLDRSGEIAAPGGWIERHDGREGDALLINGQVQPSLVVAAGQTERWRLVNAANARTMRLALPDAPLVLLATDAGPLAVPRPVNELLLAPGDRVELAVGPLPEGARLSLEERPYDRGLGARESASWATVQVGPARPSLAALPLAGDPLPALADLRTPVDRTIVLGGRNSLRHGIEFTVNDEMFPRDRPVKVGSVQVWDVVNATRMDHPFHLHGFFFQVLSIDGESMPPAERSWEDTLNIPAESTVRIAWRADDRPGEWMYHCHILEHAESGMMATFEVEADTP